MLGVLVGSSLALPPGFCVLVGGGNGVLVAGCTVLVGGGGGVSVVAGLGVLVGGGGWGVAVGSLGGGGGVSVESGGGGTVACACTSRTGMAMTANRVIARSKNLAVCLKFIIAMLIGDS